MIRLKTLVNWVKSKFFEGHERSVRAKKNILAAFFIRLVNIGITLSLVPIAIKYVNPVKYGIWVTISSIILWFGLFDVGLTNGFRNKFATAIAKNDIMSARIYLSTTYAILIIIFSSLALIFSLINPFLNWPKLLNTPPELKEELAMVVWIVFISFCMKFILQLINTVFSAFQKPALNNLFSTISFAMIFITILILVKYTSDSLTYLALIYSLIPVLTLVIVTLIFFKTKFNEFKPSIKLIDFSYTGKLMNLGIKFFILSISTVVLFNTNNVIITHLYGPESVTSYYVAFRYFNVINMIFAIIIAPFWSAHTEAWAKRDSIWIRSINRKLIKIWALICCFGILLLLFDDAIIHAWVGEDIHVSFGLSLIIFLYFCLYSFQTIFINFLNGISVIKVQLIIITLSAIINIPLAYILGKHFNIKGVVLTQVILFSITSYVLYYQYSLIIRNKAKNIWLK